MTRVVSADPSAELAAAQARISKLEAELNDRDQQLESCILEHDKDLVDLRKSFEMEAFKKPPLPPHSGLFDPHRWSMESVRLSHEEPPHMCQECVKLKKQLRTYQKQWQEMRKHFKQVPALLESMIQRTDTLVTNITQTAK
jgi:peptidoglycan hydrolase CwlO-like protein